LERSLFPNFAAPRGLVLLPVKQVLHVRRGGRGDVLGHAVCPPSCEPNSGVVRFGVTCVAL